MDLNLFGLQSSENAPLFLLPLPWELTVSFGHGCRFGPQTILASSSQLDLVDPFLGELKSHQVFLAPENKDLHSVQKKLKPLAHKVITWWEEFGNEAQGTSLPESVQSLIQQINMACEDVHRQTYTTCLGKLKNNQHVGVSWRRSLLCSREHSSCL